MPSHLLLLSVFSFIVSLPAHAAEEAGDQPVAVIFGEKVYGKDLVAPGGAKPGAAAVDLATEQRARGEALRARVWKAVFEDYARQRRIAPTEAEASMRAPGSTTALGCTPATGA